MNRGLPGILLCASLLAPCARADAASSSPLKVRSAVVCDASEEECSGEERSFGDDVAVLRFTTIVEGATGEAWVEHVWRHEGREVFRLKLSMRPRRYRTISKKTVSGLPGDWTAVVVDPVGRELASVAFRVEGPGAEASRTP